MLLSLVVWIGGLIFFSLVVAPAAFSVLPTCILPESWSDARWGSCTGLRIVSAVLYLISSLLYSRLTEGTAHVFAARHILLCLMLALTLDLAIRDHSAHGRIAGLDSAKSEPCRSTIPQRIQFDALHVWSTRVEGSVLLLGLVVVYLTARSF